MEMETETQPTVHFAELVAALEQATLMAKQLPATSDPSQLLPIHTALRSAHHRLSVFLSTSHPPPPENSVSSAVGCGDNDEIDGGEPTPMQMGDDEEDQNSRAATSCAAAVEKVEERMRDCFIQNKRPKRPLSPSAAAVVEQWRSYDSEAVKGGATAVDSERLRSLDLIYQFHA